MRIRCLRSLVCVSENLEIVIKPESTKRDSLPSADQLQEWGGVCRSTWAGLCRSTWAGRGLGHVEGEDFTWNLE